MSAGRGVTLYRSILKEHRNRLPDSMRKMGNAYVRNEFNLHKKVTKPEQLNQFFEAWTNYIEQLKGKSDGFGKSLSKKDQAVLSDEQKAKLDELKVEIERDAKKILESEQSSSSSGPKNG